jgi:hypothetical protein
MGELVTVPRTTDGLDKAARRELANALAELRRSGGTVIRAADVLGKMLGGASESVLRGLGIPTDHHVFNDTAAAALRRAYDIAILGLERPALLPGGSLPYVAFSGLAGGFAGIAGFLPDATATTLLILRDVARIAKAAGEDLSTEDARAACVAVFGLRASDEAGYFSSRMLLQGNAARAMLGQVATRWGPVLGEKFAAGAVPVLGAVAAATLNTAFLSHYRRLAKAHFTIRRLERRYGKETIRQAAEKDWGGRDAPPRPPFAN